MRMRDQNEDLVKVRFAEDETGWACRLPDGTYRIANIPLTEHLNLDDVVSVRAADSDFGFPVVNQVLKKGMARKAAVSYRTADQFVAFAQEARDEGACVEGLFGPHGDQDGLALVAYPDSFDLKVLARHHRIVVEE
jgi:hypothetical protein